jgi:hypothetical protein
LTGARRRWPAGIAPAIRAVEAHAQRPEDDPMNTPHHDRELTEAERAELEDLERLAAELRARAHSAKTPTGLGCEKPEAGPAASGG